MPPPVRPFSTLAKSAECQADKPARLTGCTVIQTLYRTHVVEQALKVVLISAFDLLKFEE